MKSNIYADMGARTDGHIYIGVVGPVRSGKSTFIKRFMETMILPQIGDEMMRKRTIDELPQSSAGKTIMTTEPKFIPEEAVRISLDEGDASIRLIDCVGYILPGAVGFIENDAPRMVATPWFDREIPFNMAAEIGTQKVMTDHSTIGLVVTSDGSFTGIERAEYEECEERIISELIEIGKPFAVVYNTAAPKNSESVKRITCLQEKYRVPVIAADCLQMSTDTMNEILSGLLYEFPVQEVRIDLPKWIMQLEQDHWLRDSVCSTIRKSSQNVQKMRDLDLFLDKIGENEYITDVAKRKTDLGKGIMAVDLRPDDTLFYKILGEATGILIDDESSLIPCMKDLAATKNKYDKIKSALDEVAATGYGIVMPSIEELALEEPQMVKQGGKYGVKLKASAPSLHILRADITAEVSPIVGRATHTLGANSIYH